MSKQRGKGWNEFTVGDKIETSGRTIESGDVNLFAGLSGDFNPLHVNAVYGEQGMFGSRVAHGLLTLAVTSGQLNQTGMFEGTTIGFLGIDKLRFTNPVRFGDTVLTTAEVTAVRESKTPGRGVVSMTVTAVNQRGESLLSYDQAVLMAAAE